MTYKTLLATLLFLFSLFFSLICSFIYLYFFVAADRHLVSNPYIVDYFYIFLGFIPPVLTIGGYITFLRARKKFWFLFFSFMILFPLLFGLFALTYNPYG